MDKNRVSRRNLIRNSSLVAAGTVAARLAGPARAVESDAIKRVATKGRIHQSVSRWCYRKW